MNNFTLSLRTERGTAFLRPSGYLDALGAEQIISASDEALLDGCRQIIFNCSNIRFINSVGISILVSMIKRVRETGCVLCFTDVSKVHLTVFDAVGITQLVPIFTSELDAVREACGRR